MKKRFYHPHEYSLLLEQCIKTTNLSPKTESIIQSIAHCFYAKEVITAKQFDTLHSIASNALTNTHHYQRFLFQLKFVEEETVEVPVFIRKLFSNENEKLALPPEKKKPEDEQPGSATPQVGTVPPQSE